MRRLVLLVALMAVGCGSESAEAPSPTPARTEPPTFPAAYLIDADATRRLADADEPFRALARDGRVIAETQWESYSAAVLDAWLEERGISVDSRRYRGLAAQLGEKHELPVLAIGPEQAAALRRLRPSERAFTRYYDAFTEDGFPEAGRAMLDWLRIFRLAAERADARHVVLIPLID